MDTRPEHPNVVAVRAKLKSCDKAHWALISKTANVSSSWLYTFARGDISNPTINNLQAVSDACDASLSGTLKAQSEQPQAA
jgi:hypothetical protein